MSSQEFTVSLRVVHPTKSHLSIVQSMGLSAEFSHSVGEPRVTPKGRPLDGHYKSTYCSFVLIEKKAGDFSKNIEPILDSLRPKKDFLDEVLREGGKAELFVGVFSDGATGFVLRADDIKLLSAFSLDLAVEVYA